MTKKRGTLLLVLGGVVLATALLWYLTYEESTETRNLQIGVNTTSLSEEHPPTIQSKQPRGPLGASSSMQKEMLETELFQLADGARKRDAVSIFKAAQKGDARAAFLVYSLASACRAGNPIWQPLVPKSLSNGSGSRTTNSHEDECLYLASGGHSPLYWLQKGASGNDLDAQVLFATNVIGFNLSRFTLTGADIDLSAANQQSLDYLANASKYGMRQAYEQLYFAYRTGALGVKNDVLAYANLYAVHLLDGRNSYETALRSANALYTAEVQAQGKGLGELYASACCLKWTRSN